tara:strand:- start:9205 stop:9318 length:114 start_codon:yes stop_codon:yes gene_type:complete
MHQINYRRVVDEAWVGFQVVGHPEMHLINYRRVVDEA